MDIFQLKKYNLQEVDMRNKLSVLGMEIGRASCRERV